MRIKLFVTMFWSMMAWFAVSAQNINVTGKVTDENGAPVPSASVTVKGTSQGVTTDAQGNYSISTAPGSVLVISGVGFDAQEYTVRGPVLNASLATGSKSLSEVVVTGFGGTQIKRDLTGNIARIKSKDIENVPLPSVDQALQGKAAGVFVNAQSGKLGQAHRACEGQLLHQRQQPAALRS